MNTAEQVTQEPLHVYVINMIKRLRLSSKTLQGLFRIGDIEWLADSSKYKSYQYDIIEKLFILESELQRTIQSPEHIISWLYGYDIILNQKPITRIIKKRMQGIDELIVHLQRMQELRQK